MNKRKFNFASLDTRALDIQALQLLAAAVVKDDVVSVGWPGIESDHKVPFDRLRGRDRAELALLDREFGIIDKRLRLASCPRWDEAADLEHIEMLSKLLEEELIQPHWEAWARSPPDVYRLWANSPSDVFRRRDFGRTGFSVVRKER
jgi:hypothetical protein